MAIVTFQAKLRQGVRALCVDKNISAGITASFSVGNYNRPIQPNNLFVITPNILGSKVKRTAAVLLCPRPQPSLTDQRYKTYGGGNNVITSAGTDNTNNWKVISNLTCQFPTYIEIDIEKLGIPEGTDCVINFDEGWLLEDRGRKLGSGAWEYPEAVQDSPSPQTDNFVTFRTPYYGVAYFNFNASINVPKFRLRLYNINQLSLFTPLFTARANKVGVIELESFSALTYHIIERKRFFGAQLQSEVEGGEPPPGFLIGNGYEYPPGSPFEYLNPGPPWTYPGWTRIRTAADIFTQPFVSTLQVDAFNLPFIWTLLNLPSTFTISPNCDAFKGVGTPHLQASASLTAQVKANYNSIIPTLNSSATLFCRTPVQGVANLTATSSLTATPGAPLTLTWFAIDPGLTTGIVLKGPNLNVSIQWDDGVTETVNGGTYNPDILDAPITAYYQRTHSRTGNLTAKIYGNLSGFQFSKNGVDLINGEINGDTNANTLFSGTWYVPGRQRLISCETWGDIGLTNLNGAFANCLNLVSVPSFLPNTATGQLSMACAFLWCAYLDDPNLIYWNTNDVGNMAGMFRNAIRMRQPIGNWNTSNVTKMSNMFNMNSTSSGQHGYTVSYPNTNVLNWDVTNVTRANMTGMFAYHNGANLDLSNWCVSHITTPPTNFTFQTTTEWPLSRRPPWGTCP